MKSDEHFHFDKCFANIMIKANRKMFLKMFMKEYPKFEEQIKKSYCLKREVKLWELVS